MLAGRIAELYGTPRAEDNRVRYENSSHQALPMSGFRSQLPDLPNPTQSPVVSTIRLITSTLNVITAAIEFFTAVNNLMNSPSRSNEDDRRCESKH